MKKIFYLSLLLVFSISCKKDRNQPCHQMLSIAGCYSSGMSSINYLGHPFPTQSVTTASLKLCDYVVVGPSAISPDGKLYYIVDGKDRSILEIDALNSSVLKDFNVDLKTPHFMYHRSASRSLIIGVTDNMPGKLFIKELDLYTGVVTNLVSCSNFSSASVRSWMVDESSQKVYFVDYSSLKSIDLISGVISKVCNVPIGNSWHLDVSEKKIYHLAVGSYFTLYSLDLNTLVDTKLKEYPDLKAVPLGGSAYDEVNKIFFVFDAHNKKLVNINVKSLACHSEAATYQMFNLEVSRLCYDKAASR